MPKETNMVQNIVLGISLL